MFVYIYIFFPWTLLSLEYNIASGDKKEQASGLAVLIILIQRDYEVCIVFQKERLKSWISRHKLRKEKRKKSQEELKRKKQKELTSCTTTYKR